MNEPTPDEMVRAVTALLPFVSRWDLPLNPEDVEVLAYAALRHARSDRPPSERDAALQTCSALLGRGITELRDALTEISPILRPAR